MPQKIDRYEIFEEIGRGGFAVVYRGRDIQLGRYVAIKELKPVLLQDQSWIDSFYHEARTVARLDHPNIVTIYDLHRFNNRLFIVMRLVDGLSLEKRITEKGRLPWPETVGVMTAIAAGLDYAHTHGILHRDLKPANILIDNQRGPLLSDFGLAKLIDQHSQNTTGTVVGTPNYIAPEVWEGRPATPESDIYALGCIVYEMLTGEKLFEGLTSPAVMMAHFKPLSLPNTWPQDVPPAINTVLQTALANTPDQRFASAGEMSQALARLALSKDTWLTLQPRREAPKFGPLVKTKLYTPPARPNVIARQRLLNRLNQGLNPGCKLTLISAPAGFGKTTLVSNWIHQQDEGKRQRAETPKIQPANLAWFSLDDEDNDPVRFINYLVTALQNLDNTVGQALLKSRQLPPSYLLITYLVNDLAAITYPFALILNDYHVIQAEPVHELVDMLLEHQPPHMHLIITTREDPPLPLSRLRARGQIVEIRQDNLRFTPEETSAFLNESMGLALTPQVIAALETRTEGWIAGLQLAALSLQGRDTAIIDQFINAFSGSHRYIIDYLIEEVVAQQPEHIKQFLHQTAILDRLNPYLCNAVTGRADSRTILTQLEHANLFIFPLDDHRDWFRYHNLFAEFLRTETPLPMQVSLHQKAAQWFEANNLLPSAIKHALLAQDFATAARLITRIGDTTIRNGRLVTLNNWLNALPNEMVLTNGELATFKGWATWLLGNVEIASSYAEAAAAALSANTPAAIKGKLLGLQACIAISRDLSGMDFARKIIPQLEETDTFYVGFTLLVLGEAQNFMGDTEGAVETLQQALRLGHKHDDSLMIVGALANLAQQLNWRGKRHEAVALCQQALEESLDSQGRPKAVTRLAYTALAEMELHAGNLKKTQEYMDKGRKLIPKEEMVVYDISDKLVLGPLYYALGRREEALKITQEARRLVASGWFDSYVGVVSALEADFLLKLEKTAAVEEWAAAVNPPGPNERLSITRALELIFLGRYFLATSHPEAAHQVLRQVIESVRQTGHNVLIIYALLLRTKALLAQGKYETAQDALAEAVKLAAPEQYRYYFLAEGEPILNLLPQVRSVNPEFVDSIFEIGKQWGHGKHPDALPNHQPARAASQSLIEPLSERELEVLALIAQGCSNKETADRLFVTVGTVKKHLSNMFGKLGVNSRTQAVAKARELGLME